MSLKQILRESFPPRLSKVTRVVEGVADKIIESLGLTDVSWEDKKKLMLAVLQHTQENIHYNEISGHVEPIAQTIQSEFEIYSRWIQDLPDVLKQSSVTLFRFLYLKDAKLLNDHLGFHWVTDSLLLSDGFWRMEIGADPDDADGKGEYVLCGEIDPRHIDAIQTVCTRIRYPSEKEITLTGKVTANRFRSLYFYRLENLDPKDIHNGNYLKKLK